MLYTELKTKDNIYKLRLDMKNMVNLEKALGKSPLTVIIDLDNGSIPSAYDLLTILHYCLQPLNHEVNTEMTYKIMDSYVEEGNTMLDIIPVFVEVFQNCGYIAKDKDDEEKN